jgi:type I restriction enzyme M protein
MKPDADFGRKKGSERFLRNREELINCDKASRDIFGLRDESLEESDNLPDPDVLAQEIVEDREVANELRDIVTENDQ